MKSTQSPAELKEMAVVDSKLLKLKERETGIEPANVQVGKIKGD